MPFLRICIIAPDVHWGGTSDPCVMRPTICSTKSPIRAYSILYISPGIPSASVDLLSRRCFIALVISRVEYGCVVQFSVLRRSLKSCWGASFVVFLLAYGVLLFLHRGHVGCCAACSRLFQIRAWWMVWGSLSWLESRFESAPPIFLVFPVVLLRMYHLRYVVNRSDRFCYRQLAFSIFRNGFIVTPICSL